jgi:hypothetical protein
MIIGVVGFLGSGKGTVGDMLIQDHHYYRLSFADGVKDAVSVIFGWPRELLEGDTDASRAFREMPDVFWSERFGYEVTPRYMLQLMGTEAGRDVFHSDIWIYSLEKRMLGKTDVVIPDVRFPNEIDFIKSRGGKVIRVVRGPEPEWYQSAIIANKTNNTDHMGHFPIHYSEWAWIGQDFDHVLDNNGTMNDLKVNLNKFLKGDL